MKEYKGIEPETFLEVEKCSYGVEFNGVTLSYSKVKELVEDLQDWVDHLPFKGE